jgi:hypothetical protein
MVKPVQRRYVVERNPKLVGFQWQVFLIMPDGTKEWIGAYRTQQTALNVANSMARR